MNYSPKLKTAMERIKAILKEYDIAGHVVLHTPGFSEYHLKLDPSYSCAKMTDEGIFIRGKLERDFGGDKKLQIQKLTDTVNMFIHFTDTVAPQVVGMIDVMEALNKNLDIEKRGGGHSSHTTQNN